MIPCSSWQSFQLPDSLIRLPQPQPEFGALDPDCVREGELAVDRGCARTGFVLVPCGLGRLGGLIVGCLDWVVRHGSGFAYFDVHAGDYGGGGWTLAVYPKIYLQPRTGKKCSIGQQKLGDGDG